MSYARVVLSIFLVIVALGFIYLLRLYAPRISATAQFLLITGSSSSLIIGIGLGILTFIRAITEQESPFSTLKDFSTERMNFEERAHDMYEHMAKYLKRDDYIGAQYALEFDVGQLGSELVHHGNPETRRYLFPIGLAASMATDLCKERIGKMPLVGKWIRLAYRAYSGPLGRYKFEGKNIGSRMKNYIYDFADLTHRRFDAWMKYHRVKPEQRNAETWIKYWKDAYTKRKWENDPVRFGSLYDHLREAGALYKEIVERGVDKK
jgi:hypothetical protein